MILAIVLLPQLCGPIKTLILFKSISTFFIGPIFLIIRCAILAIYFPQRNGYSFSSPNSEKKKVQQIARRGHEKRSVVFIKLSPKTGNDNIGQKVQNMEVNKISRCIEQTEMLPPIIEINPGIGT